MQENMIVTLVRGEPLLTTESTVSVSDTAQRAIDVAVARATAIKSVKDERSQQSASLAGQELQALIKGLEASHDLAKGPILAIGRAIDGLLKTKLQPLKEAANHIDYLVSKFQDEMRVKRELAQAKIKVRQQQEREAKIRELAELEARSENAKLRARLAEDAADRVDAQRLVKALEPAISVAKITVQVGDENLPVTNIPETPKPLGGRVWTQYIVTMTDSGALAQEHPELVDVRLKQAAAQEFAKCLDEAGKPLNSIKGLHIQKTTRTSFVGAASIRIEDRSEV